VPASGPTFDPRLTLVENGENLGLAAGNDRVLDRDATPYPLFLNPDDIVGPQTLPRMLAFMEATPDAGMAGCIIRNPDGTEQVASRRVIPDPPGSTWCGSSIWTGSGPGSPRAAGSTSRMSPCRIGPSG
jgi:GT2 family glycosyltransferase